jgi:hypothetical protein
VLPPKLIIEKKNTDLIFFFLLSPIRKDFPMDEHQIRYDDDDDIRPSDRTYQDRLMGGIDRREVRSSIEGEEDVYMKIAMEESLRAFEKEEDTKRRLAQLEEERIREEQKKIAVEMNRVRELREKLGIVIQRIRVAFAKDEMAVDLLAWIEWECTPTHHLESFRPRSKHSILEIREWMSKNLNPSVISLLESSLSCL